jgi:hypothetical protein
MSDFLTNLLARNSRSAEVIRPRLPSLFEPLGLAAGLPAMARFALLEENEISESPTRPPAARPVLTRGPSMADERPSPPRLESRAVVPPSEPDLPGPKRTSPTRTIEPTPELVRPPTRPAFQAFDSPPNPSRAPVPDSPALTPARDSSFLTPARYPLVVSLPTRPAGDGENRPREATLADQPSPAAETRTSSRSDRVPFEGPASSRVVSADSPADQISQLVRSILRPHVASRPEGLKQDAAQSRAGRPEPTVQVTIGRIEVRAAPQQQPSAPRERAASPVTGLDEYLRSRQRRAGE